MLSLILVIPVKVIYGISAAISVLSEAILIAIDDTEEWIKKLTMNENLNLVEILKDCPKGTKLYSTIFGDVKFEEINKDRLHPIIVKICDGHTEYFTADGKKYYGIYNGECTLFPSKEQRDWSKFKPKKTIEKWSDDENK